MIDHFYDSERGIRICCAGRIYLYQTSPVEWTTLIKDYEPEKDDPVLGKPAPSEGKWIFDNQLQAERTFVWLINRPAYAIEIKANRQGKQERLRRQKEWNSKSPEEQQAILDAARAKRRAEKVALKEAKRVKQETRKAKKARKKEKILRELGDWTG